MINYDKVEIRNQLELDDIFQLLLEFGGSPEYTNFGIISATICHNKPNEGSRKLYYYTNSGLFVCYTGCEEPHFDIFELVRKVARIQWSKEYDLNTAIRWVAQRFDIAGTTEDGEEADQIEDWKILADYDKEPIDRTTDIKLKIFDKKILNNFNYSVQIMPWLNENISQEVLDYAKIGYYPGKEQITIPHFDENDNLIGIRGRTLSQEDAELYGKYRPIQVNKTLYNHPLGYTLYGLNWAKDNIKLVKTAIIVEGEKSVLHYMSDFGIENDICVAACGSSVSAHQIQKLLDLGVREIVIAFDRQFQEIGDEEYNRWIKKLTHLSDKYKNDCLISFIFDTDNLLKYKESPLDETKEVFLELFNNRLDGNGRKYGV